MPVANPLVGGVPWDARQEQIKRALAEAAALRQASGEQPQGRLVSGIYVAPHWSQQMGPLVNALRGSVKEYEANRDQQKLDQEMAADATQWMSSRPQGQTVELEGPQPEGATGPLTGTTPPTLQQKMEWAQRGQTNPLTRALAAAYGADTLIKEPEREEARQFRREEAAAARAANAEAARQKAADRLEEIKLRLEDRALDRASRETLAREGRELQAQLAKMADATRREIAANSNALRRDLTEKPKELKPLPAAQSKAWVENEASLEKVDDTLNMLQDEKANIRHEARRSMNAAYAIPFAEDVGQRLDPKGVPLRAAIADLGSLKLHDRSGAAVTAAEFPRLKPFIPTAADTPESARDKLNNFKKEYERIQQELLNYAEDQGYKPPVSRRTPAPTAPAPTGIPSGWSVTKGN